MITLTVEIGKVLICLFVTFNSSIDLFRNLTQSCLPSIYICQCISLSEKTNINKL